MFEMKIEKQLNISDRTLLLGVPRYDAIPKAVKIEQSIYKVIGLSQGAKPPFVSLEIEKTKHNLKGKNVVDY